MRNSAKTLRAFAVTRADDHNSGSRRYPTSANSQIL